jgi:2-haloacid dehalogenase
MNKIKVLLWDIDGTLLDFKAAEKVAIRKCFDIFELGACSDEMLKTYGVINKGYWERLERGEVTKKEVLEGRFHDFFAAYGLPVDKAAQVNAQYQKSLGDTIVFYENGLELVKELKGKILQYAVTNGTKVAQDRKLNNSGLIHIFDDIFISEEIGVEKPGIGFFEKVFQVIGQYDPSEVLIVGDSLTSDIRGGNNAGILTCWFNPDGKEKDVDVHVDYEISNLGQLRELLS